MKEITVILICTWKFALTFPVAIFGMKFSFWKTIILTNAGGLIGLLVSVYLSHIILFLSRKYIYQARQKNKPVFTRRNRFFVTIKKKYGLAGIVIFTHSVLSIPVGAFLTIRYYDNRLKNLFILFAAQIAWSFVYTIFYMYVRDLLIFG